MRILVAVASKHAATREIARSIGDAMAARGLTVEVVDAAAGVSVAGFDAAVIGSAVYAGHWMGEARELVERAAADLRQLPVWLFSSGPVGDPPKPQEDPVDVSAMLELSGAREHTLFAGRIDKSRLGLGERAIVAALHAPTGDFRDWEAIRTWAGKIADDLLQGAPIRV